ncbi:hypothetical protein NS14008_38005 [Nocardia seriolae]|uniref:hypothetical protein n=1 Tax=Nocardia seriolae TaxID=37332 RepID=UPI000911991E|nr:hypothetical protein [Nocardia seriolae]OJF83850.1 hypothetical protein NS14008_38005 [Nocardia seriolae]
MPDPRNRVRRNWPPAPEGEPDWDDEDAEPRRPEGEDRWDEPESDDHRDDPDREPEEGWRRDQGRSAPPGGPFHPGFRPYQGPAPR